MRRRREREGGGETRREEEKNRRGREDCWHDHTGIPQCKQARLCQAKKTLGFTEYCESFIANRCKDKKPSHGSKTTLPCLGICRLWISVLLRPRVSHLPARMGFLPPSSSPSPPGGGERRNRWEEERREDYVSAVVCTCVAGVGRGVA